MTVYDVEVTTKGHIYFLQMYVDSNNTPADFEVIYKPEILKQFNDGNALVKLLCTSIKYTHINIFTENLV